MTNETIARNDPITPDTTLTDLVDAYLEGWNEEDPSARLQRVQRVFTDESRHVDPLVDARGHGAIDAMIAGLQSQFPAHKIVRTTGIDGHNELFRFGWEVVDPEGTAVIAGTDVAIRAEDGRIQAVAGFFGELPER